MIHPNFLKGSGHTSPSQLHILLKPRVHEFEKPEKEVVSKYFPRLAQPVSHKYAYTQKLRERKPKKIRKITSPR